LAGLLALAELAHATAATTVARTAIKDRLGRLRFVKMSLPSLPSSRIDTDPDGFMVA
jgi:hypothetical protein